MVAASNSLVYAVGGNDSIVTFDRDLSVPQPSPPSGQPPANPGQTAKKKSKCQKHKHKKHKRAAEAKKKHKKKCKRKKKRRSA